jgi:seryl-tRNA synthetase
MSKIRIKIDSKDSLETLLQKVYDECDMEMNQAQDQINLLRNSSNLKDESLDAKTKYSKSINDMLSIKEKMLKAKIDVGKILSEVIKSNGDIGKANENMMSGSFDIESLKKTLNEIDGENEKKQNYIIKK